jgi:hypothetical protein
VGDPVDGIAAVYGLIGPRPFGRKDFRDCAIPFVKVIPDKIEDYFDSVQEEILKAVLLGFGTAGISMGIAQFSKLLPEKEAKGIIHKKISEKAIDVGIDRPIVIGTMLGKVTRSLEEAGVPTAIIGRITGKERGVKRISEGRITDLPRFDRDEITRILE